MVSKGVSIKMGNLDEYLHGYLIDVENEDVNYTSDFANNLKEFKNRLHAKCIDSTFIKVDGREFVVVSSDKMDKGHISALDRKGSPVMRGNLLIFGIEECPGGVQFKSLDDNDIRFLAQKTGLMHISCPDGTTYNTYTLHDVEVI